MKQTLRNYAFDKTAKTVTLTDFSSISLDRLYLITNVTTNTIIYQFNSSALGGTVSTNVLTLTFNTSSMANTDKLQIIYDVATADPSYDVRTVSGTVTANMGTTNGLALDATLTAGTLKAQGNVASAATDSGNPVKVGGVYNTTPPTLTNGQRGDLQVDSLGSLKVSSSIAANSSVNVNQVGGTAVDTNSGAKSAGTQRIVLATDQPQLTNALKVDGSGATQPVSGTVTANAGTNLNTSALAVESGGNLATVAGAVIAQEATTSGTKGITAFGAVTTAAPSYTTAKNDALSLDTSGLLRVSLKDTPANTTKLLVTPDSVALPANQSVNVNQINGVTPLMGNGATGTGSPRVTIASDNTAFAVNATLAAETTKAIGVVRNADGSGNLLTSTSSALDVNVKSGTVTDTYATDTTFTITLASLGNSATVGRQSTLVDNTTNKYLSALVYLSITVGTTPTLNTPIFVYLIRSNNDNPIVDDGGGASDAGITINNAPLLGVINCSAATSNVAYVGIFDTSQLGPLGPKWGIAVVNNTAVALNATEGNHLKTFIGITKGL